MIAVLGSAGITIVITIAAIWHWREVFIIRTPREPRAEEKS